MPLHWSHFDRRLAFKGSDDDGVFSSLFEGDKAFGAHLGSTGKNASTLEQSIGDFAGQSAVGAASFVYWAEILAARHALGM